MGRVADQIREAVREDRYIFGVHADEMLRERFIVAWQVVAAMDHGKLMAERPRARPNPVAEFELILSDATRFKAVWAWVRRLDAAKLVTVHFFNR